MVPAAMISPMSSAATGLLTIARMIFAPQSTIGIAFWNGNPECFILEDAVREPGMPEIPGQTAIPYGTYPLIVDYSPRFKEDMPHLLHVPHLGELWTNSSKDRGIRIHWGNKPEDTEGCLCTGETFDFSRPAWVAESRVAYEALLKKLVRWQKNTGPMSCRVIRLSH